MATSGTYTWATNTNTVINNALLKINRKRDNETVASGDSRYDNALAALNPIIQKNSVVHGMPLWAVNEATIAFSTSGLNATTGTLIGISQTINQVAPLRVIQAIRRDSSTASAPIDVPMEIYTYDYYESLSQKASTGAPVGIFYQPIAASATAVPNSGRIKLWLLPSSYWTTNGSLIIRYIRPFQDQAAGTGEFDFPNYWIHALTYQLAYALAPDYGLDPTQRGFLAKDMQAAITLNNTAGTRQCRIVTSGGTTNVWMAINSTATTTQGMLLLGGTVECFTLPQAASTLSFISTATGMTVYCTIGVGS